MQYRGGSIVLTRPSTTRIWWPMQACCVATLMVRLGLESLINDGAAPGGSAGSRPGRKILTLVRRSWRVAPTLITPTYCGLARRKLSPFRVMAPSTIGTFLRSFTFGHVRQLDAVIAETIRRVWALGAGPGSDPLVIDIDSTITEVHGKAKQGAGYGYTRQLGYHPLLATRADTGEILHVRTRKGSANTRAAPSASSKNSSPASAGPAPPARSSCAPTRGSTRTRPSPRSACWGCATRSRSPSTRRSRPPSPASPRTAWVDIVYPDGGAAQVAGPRECRYKGNRPAHRAPHPPHRRQTATALARLAPPRLRHRPDHRQDRRRPVPPPPRRGRVERSAT